MAMATVVAVTAMEAEAEKHTADPMAAEARLAPLPAFQANFLQRQSRARRECRPSRARPKRDPPWCSRGQPGRRMMHKAAGSTRSTLSSASHRMARRGRRPCSDLVIASAAFLQGVPCAPCGLDRSRRHRRCRCIRRLRRHSASDAAFGCVSFAWALRSDHSQAPRRPRGRPWDRAPAAVHASTVCQTAL